jgi:hypothetical protein
MLIDIQLLTDYNADAGIICDIHKDFVLYGKGIFYTYTLKGSPTVIFHIVSISELQRFIRRRKLKKIRNDI